MLPRAALISTLLLTACAPAEPAKTQGAPPAPPAPPAGETPAAACLRTAGSPRSVSPKEPARVSAKHVLVKYAGAKNAAASITRSREDACLRALEARDKLRGGADFAEIVKLYSDEAGAATRG